MSKPRPKLLLIDDDVSGCEAIAATLELRGYDVASAHSGSDALAVLEREDTDAVVSDLNMPGMTGIEFCGLAQARWPELPIVLMTAFGSMETAVTAIRGGAYDFIAKPIQVPEL